MQRARSASFASKFAAGLLALACLAPAFAQPAAAPSTIRIDEADVLVSDSVTEPPATAPWQHVKLTHRTARQPGGELTTYWYRVEFTLEDASQSRWLYLPRLRSGAQIYLNGHYVAGIRGADEKTQVRWFRPHLLILPAGALRAGTNRLAFHFTIREPLTSFGYLEIGAEQPMRAEYDRMMFLEQTSVDITTSICILGGLFLLAFWMRRPQEGRYGLFGVCVVLWGLRTWIFRLPEVPMDDWLAWRTAYYFTTVGFITCITAFLFEFGEDPHPRINRLLVLNWLGGCIVFVAVGVALRPIMDAVWVVSFLPFTVYAYWRQALHAVRTRSSAGISLSLAILFSIFLAVHDYCVQHGLFDLTEIYLLHLGVPILLAIIGFLQLERHVVLLHHSENMNELLAQRVATRENELMASHEALRKLEREHAATEERKRIMQDMHDGVGSQLVSALVMARRGAVTPEGVEALLQECIDDMRLVIDALSPNEPDLLPVLGNLRYRMETRFHALGIKLDWRNHALPDSLLLAPHEGLQVLRILQEALTNVIKHARAANVQVDLDFAPDSLGLRIRDDGIGFDAANPPRGRGLSNMQVRAERLRAAFSMASDAQGTTLSLQVPMPATA